MFNKFILFLNLVFFTMHSDARNTLPEIGTIASSTLSIDQEKEYGWAFRLMANQALPLVHDPVLNNYINTLGQNIVQHADSVKLPFYFFLVDDTQINAAAFLGGNIKINTGLFLYADNESELAGVIAHEITHITQRHLARILEQQATSNSASMAAIAGSILLSLVSPTAGIAALTTTMAVNIQTQINYTRLHEYEADRIGIATLYAAGYDANGMANFFAKLADKYKYASAPPQMLSTHPLPATRLAEARLRAGQLPTQKVNSSLGYQLSKARISVRYNKISAKASINFYQNSLENHTYKLQEAAEYGLALAYFQDKNAVKSQAILTPLLKARPDNLFYLDLMTDTLITLKQTNKAVLLLQPKQRQSPDNAVLTLNLIIALQKENKPQQAYTIISHFLRRHPMHILAYKLAIKLAITLKKRDKEHALKAKYLALQGQFRQASQEMGSALIYAQSDLDQARYSAYIASYKKQDLRLQSLQK